MKKKSTKKGQLSKKKTKNLEQKDEKVNHQDNNGSSLSDFERGYIEGKKAVENSRLLYKYDMNRSMYAGQYNERNNRPSPKRRPVNQYGEHPESLGHLEYEGSNKRHSGLGYNDYIATEENREDLSQNGNGQHFNRDRKNVDKKYKNKKPGSQTGFNVKRRLGDTSIYFRNNDKETYQNEYDSPSDINLDRDFQEEGHQYSGEIEGFGNRTGQRHGQDWIEQDYYRGGHSQTKRGHGRYGSR